MSKIIFQIVSKAGILEKQHIDWQTESHLLFERMEEFIFSLPDSETVFVVIDLYSEFKERKKLPSEVIIEKQIEAVEQGVLF